MSFSLSQFALIVKRDTQIIVGDGVIGVDAQIFSILGNRFVQLSLIVKCDAQIVVGIGVVGVDVHAVAVDVHPLHAQPPQGLAAIDGQLDEGVHDEDAVVVLGIDNDVAIVHGAQVEGIAALPG